jgi:hypothetical protein
VKATLALAKKQGFKEHGADPRSPRDAAGCTLADDPVEDKAIKDFVMHMVNTGSIDIGSQARALGRAAEGNNSGRFDDVMRWAASGSYYLEMTTRLVAALAARDIAKSKGMELYDQQKLASDVVNQSLFNYSEGNRARAFGRQGIIGEATPLATASSRSSSTWSRNTSVSSVRRSAPIGTRLRARLHGAGWGRTSRSWGRLQDRSGCRS